MTASKALFDLSQKVCLVTGANRGLGRAIAIGLAEAGADVIIACRDKAAGAAVAGEIASQGRRAQVVPCDMERWSDIDTLVKAACDSFGRLDVLVNNAGIAHDPLPLTDVDEGMFDRFFHVNTRGPMRLASLVAQRMAQSGGGSIVNILTFGAIKPGGYLSMYCSSKAAMRSLNRSMAEEWAPLGIRVNAIAPGPFMTDMLKDLAGSTEGFMDFTVQTTLLKRVAEPHEIVGPVVFLASAASSYVTGQILPVCGGGISM
ncbi:MAG: 4-formylbenzenesulfonate dehydrogenase TsaC1/TsaC2 [Steroidobacteraceae bacterium]|nr:4-formylbenzenesulfonate dehydrogenase TsaC1/TsaC2 [Steroidobacteraceae bacterium]